MEHTLSARTTATDLAIVGVALRLPGARTMDEFWTNLDQGRSSISEVPQERWRAADYAGDPRRDGNKTSSVRGGFVEDMAGFDADFFRVSPREARLMDPQQRLALELSWHAVEDAGYRADRLTGSRTGVFVGVCHWDYAELMELELPAIDAYYPTGAAYSIIANRVSHFFDFRGPSVVNDTACASSLVSVQQAAQALLAGDCDQALAGGVNLIWSPRHFVAFSKAGMLSPDGVCRAFDADANGYVRGEGGGMLMLKRAADAIRDGDPIHALVKAIGTNHGGRTSSLTVTSSSAQADLIVDTYRRSGIDPGTVSYVEAHGTGTPIGDPIEIRGLKRAFAELGDDTTDQRCGIGSVKANIGHLEGAAGVAGILKVILAMRHRRLPATVGFTRLNPLIELEGTPFRIVDSTAGWDAPDGPLRAGVSSFGFGGTNAHAVLESPPSPPPMETTAGPQWLPVSAQDPERLRELCAVLAAWVRAREAGPEPPTLADIAHTLRHGRTPFPERVVFHADDLTGWAEQLEALARGDRTPVGCLAGHAEPAAGLEEADLTVLTARWREQGRADKAASAWVHGLPVDWSQWPTTGRRVHLPGYSFARTRYWFRPLDGAPTTSPVAPPNGAPVALVPPVPSPLPHRAPTAAPHTIVGPGRRNAHVWTFPLRFPASQDVVRDHVVNGTRIVPGVTVLDLVLAAGATAEPAVAPGAARLRHVVWARPLTVTGDELSAELRLTRTPDGYDFAVLGADGTRCAAGRLSTGETRPDRIDLAALRERYPAPLDVAEGYAALRASGIVHGPALRGMREVRRGDDGILARIEVPAGTSTGWYLNPAILDSALQAALAVGAGSGGWRRPDAVAMPFALDELTVCAATPGTVTAVFREVPAGPASKVDVDLYAEDGSTVARLRGYTSRPSSDGAGTGGRTRPADGDLIEVRQVWREAAPASTGVPGTLVLLNAALDDRSARDVADRLDAELLPLPAPVPGDPVATLTAAFRACYQHLQHLLGRSVRVVLTAPGRADDPGYAPLAALLRTAHKENPALRGKLVLVEDLAAGDTARFERIVRAELGDPDTEVAYDRADRRRCRQASELGDADAGTEPLLRRGGVYWITGGAGGVGRLVAGHLSREYDATVVLSGRREATPAELDDRVVYRRVDVTDPTDVRAVAAGIRQAYGRLDGVFHAAGTLDDGYLVTKPVDEAVVPLAPKLAGTVHLAEVRRTHGASFLLLFGSVAGAFGSAAQAGYAVANAFLDAYAAGDPAIRVVDWPLWADGGMRVDPATEAYLRKTNGMVPLPTPAALAALERAMHTDTPAQRVVLYGERDRLRRYAGLVVDETRPVSASTAPAAAAVVLDDSDLAARTEEHLRALFAELTGQEPERIRADQKLEQYGINSLVIVDVTSRLEDDFGSLPKTLFFEHVNLRGVAGYLLAEHRDRLRQMFTPTPTPTPAPAPTPDRSRIPEPLAAVPAPTRVPDTPTPAAVATPVVRLDTPESPARDAGRARRRDERGTHDIAVIGLAGRYPGADTVEEFWRLLSDGRHRFEPVPAHRWPHADLYRSERDVLGKSVVRTGTFLRDIDAFDPRYFNISQREAERIAPEVRLLLQAGVTALEDAGYSRETIQRRYQGDVGVLVGSMNNSYGLYGFQNMLVRGAVTSGSEIGVFANMLSYFYGLTGPSMFLDTMCASSSTCVHQAVRMLREGECRMAVVGGINLMLHPYDVIATSQAHFTTKSAELLRSYGLGADGTLLGEGVGMVVLKPLAAAETDGDRILGVIRGTGMTNAGIRNGFTVPSPTQQARAIERALDDAGVNARTISYLEGHGSATSLGDPIEITGATAAFRRDTADSGFCAIGSVKSNIAHLLSGSGIAGLTKVLLQLRYRTIVKSLHAETLNPGIDFANTPFAVQRERTTWGRPVIDGETVPRRAGVTSIGAGGANVHIIVEEHEAVAWGAAETGRPQLLTVSATTPGALGRVLRDLHAYVSDTTPGLDSLAYASQTGKNELPCRLAFVATDPAHATRTLAVLAALPWQDGPTLPDGVRFTPSTMREQRTPDPAAVTRALRDRDLAALADDWIAGAEVDWDVLWPPVARPTRLALPGYPFDRIRCWYPEAPDAPTVLHPLAFARRSHPWVGANESGLAGICYRLALRGDELLDYGYALHRDRRYATTALLDAAPALARLAGLGERQWAVRDARWATLPAPADQTELLWSLTPTPSGTHRAELRRAADRALVFTAELTPHGSGPDHLDPASTAPDTMGQKAFVARLGELGVDCRPYAFGVHGVAELPDGRLLLRVSEPAQRQDRHPRQVRVPAWVDTSLLQGVQHLFGRGDVTVRRVDTAFVADGGRTRMLLVERTGPDAVDVRLLDGEGRAVGWISGAEFVTDLPDELAAAADVVAHPVSTCATDGGQLLAVAPGGAPPIVDEVTGTREAAGVLETVRQTVARLLKADGSEVDEDTHFMAFGFDSIMLTTLAAELSGALGVDLRPSWFFECPNIRTLMRRIGDQMPRRAPAPPPAALVPPAHVSAGPLGGAGAHHARRTSGGGGPGDDLTVAIVGMAGRFPGADDPEAFWQRLRAGDDLVSSYPDDRFDQRYAPLVAGSDFPRYAGRLDGVDRFDADFFTVSRLEAELMDPQQRLVLEAVWAALEDGGHPPARLPVDTGVFVGVSGTDYHHLLNASGVAPDGYTATGNSHAVLANRVSYLLDVRGPSEPVDTACSSSLVALHRAVESVRSGRCGMAVAGGVNLLLSVDTFAATQMSGMLSPTGRCRAFAAGADGYVRAEAVVAVLLKPLDAALRDGDVVHGVVLGSAENHGGRAASLTAPNATAQNEVIRMAMRGVDPDSVGYVEAHGTGTALGDPVEVDALTTAYRELGGSPLVARGLGSVKTNIGHAEAAAGLVGVVKVLLAMRHGELPPVLHCAELNPGLRLDGSGFEVVRERRRWTPRTGPDGQVWPLRAGVSSFGFGGVNAHVVLEAPPPAVPTTTDPEPQVVVLSARDDDRLRAVAARLHGHLHLTRSEGRAPTLSDLAFTLQLGREGMEHRLGFVASTMDEVVAALDRFLAGDRVPGGHTGRLPRSRGTGVRRDPASTPAVREALHQGDLGRVIRLWCAGESVDWTALHPPGKRRVVSLPTYPFAGERHWVPASAAAPVPVGPESVAPTPHPVDPPAFDPDLGATLLAAVLDNRASPDALDGLLPRPIAPSTRSRQ